MARRHIPLIALLGALCYPHAIHSQLLSDAPPAVMVVKSANTVLNLIVSGLFANKGIVVAADSDRFILEADAEFSDAITHAGPELRNGSQHVAAGSSPVQRNRVHRSIDRRL